MDVFVAAVLDQTFQFGVENSQSSLDFIKFLIIRFLNLNFCLAYCQVLVSCWLVGDSLLVNELFESFIFFLEFINDLSLKYFGGFIVVVAGSVLEGLVEKTGLVLFDFLFKEDQFLSIDLLVSDLIESF